VRRNEQTTESPVYVCDLDGTLLRSDATLSEFAKRGLSQLAGAGVRLTVASGRGAPAMRALLAEVPIELPVIELNGAFVSELESGRHLISNTLSSAEACAGVEAILETGVDPVLTSWDGRCDRVHFGDRANESNSWYVAEKRAYDDPRLTPCDDLLAVARAEQVAQITTFAPNIEAAGLAQRLREVVGPGAIVHSQSNTYSPAWTEILVQHKAAEKGAAVPALLAACEAEDDGIVACGDQLNDLGMFAVAARSIAPANAHPSVLAAATEVVDSNDNDGIVRYLLDHHALSDGVRA